MTPNSVIVDDLKQQVHIRTPYGWAWVKYEDFLCNIWMLKTAWAKWSQVRA
jgi:hypothetical protein